MLAYSLDDDGICRPLSGLCSPALAVRGTAVGIVSLCLCVCIVHVCPDALKFTRSSFISFFFYAGCLWQWLRAPLTTIRYVMYFRYCG